MGVRAQTVNGQDSYTADPPAMGAAMANVGAITTTETTVVSAAIPSGAALLAKAGVTLRFCATGVMTNTATASTWTLRVRIGTQTKTGAAVAQDTFVSGTVVRTNAPCMIEGQVTIRTTGASGTAIGHALLIASGLTAGGAGLTAPVTINTTTATLVELTAIGVTGAPSLTFHTATIEVM